MYKRIFGVHVNIDAFKDYKSLDALKKEPGKIFEHLRAEADKAYSELMDIISPKKEVKPAEAKVTPDNTEVAEAKPE